MDDILTPFEVRENGGMENSSSRRNEEQADFCGWECPGPFTCDETGYVLQIYVEERF